jgi:3'-5' exoribonuclease
MSLFETNPIVPLSEMTDGLEADCFALLADKQQLLTRDNKPYYRVTFRDAKRDVTFPIWSDAPLCVPCRDEWEVGQFYKLRTLYRDTNYGPQLEIRKIRPVEPGDAADGFDPLMCQPRSRFEADQMYADLMALADEHITSEPLRELVVGLFEEHKECLLVWPAAVRNHHAYISGWLEHVRNVTRTAAYLANYYAEIYPHATPPLDKGLVVAGAMLHDIGKIYELRTTPMGAEYTASGGLIGHVLQGRDLVRDSPLARKLDAEMLLRLEHIIVSHQRLPEWGSPKPPMTPEAMLVHFADDCDAKFLMVINAIAEDAGDGPLTSRRNPLNQNMYRGGE